jgi:hypothetical protein
VPWQTVRPPTMAAAGLVGSLKRPEMADCCLIADLKLMPASVRECLLPKKKPGRSGAFLASLITLSWNQVLGFLTDWEGLLRIVS